MNPHFGVDSERGGFGFRSPTSCRLAPTRPPALAPASMLAYLVFTRRASVSNPHFGVNSERGGFEPPVPFGTQPFQDCTIDHSDIFPNNKRKTLSPSSHNSFLSERGGFEPPELFSSTVFETARFDRSRIFPFKIITWNLLVSSFTRLSGFEPPAFRSAIWRSIQLSYSLLYRKRQESNLPGLWRTDGLAIRCITALPRFLYAPFPWGSEQGGFEPPVPCSTTVFKTAALNHSATAPEKCLIILARKKYFVKRENTSSFLFLISYN